MPRNQMTAEQLKSILENIASVLTEKQLGEIMHDSPNWDYMDEAQCKAFRNAIDARRIFLDDKKLIANMTVADRDRYISGFKKYASRLALVAFAEEIQPQIIAAVAKVDFDLALDQLKVKSLEVAKYMHEHIFSAVDWEYGYYAELNAQYSRLIIKKEHQVIDAIMLEHAENLEILINTLVDRLIQLRKELFKAKQKFGGFCDHALTMRSCCNYIEGKIKSIQMQLKAKNGNVEPIFFKKRSISESSSESNKSSDTVKTCEEAELDELVTVQALGQPAKYVRCS